MACGYFGCRHVHGVSVGLCSHVHQDGPHALPGNDVPDKGELFILRVAGSHNIGFLHDILLKFRTGYPRQRGRKAVPGKGQEVSLGNYSPFEENLRNVPAPLNKPGMCHPERSEGSRP
ncbi:hypothetical protein SDC9_185915 [bioreactor metagenome]|uniref:Uncharacterized protein n=1 Tax=bioreactor metagenome TaxID=1076179 RepID=A0A645HH88_9ZZZZ